MEVIRKNTDIHAKYLKRMVSGDLFVHEGTLYMKSEDLGKSKECFRCIDLRNGWCHEFDYDTQAFPARVVGGKLVYELYNEED